MLLFEEFVPYEYRAQMASHGSKPSIRQRMPAFFTQGKGRQWKQAATLNGRPYVVGSVPGSPSPREVEFEAMLLRGAGSVTKVITLDQASRSQSQLKVQVPAKTPVKGAAPAKVVSPAKAASPTKDKRLPAIIDTLRPILPARELPPKPESPMLPSLPAAPTQITAEGESVPSTPSGRRPRFKLPGVGSSAHRRGMMEPAEYDKVEFETRLASYSDDELNGGSGRSSRDKERRQKRMSKDDAWVDIMVASQGSRMKGQDAELRPRGAKDKKALGGGRSDPDLASQEIAQVLAAVQQQRTDDEDEVDGRRGAGAGAGAAGATAGDEEEDTFVPVRKPRPLGYFDLHPERRPRPSEDSVVTVPDPSGGADGINYLEIPSEPDVAPPIPPRVSEDSFYSSDMEGSQTGGDWVRRSDGDIEVPAFPEEEEPQLFLPDAGKLRPDSATLPLNIPFPSRAAAPAAAAAATLVPGKTAALIEMYRQKELQAQPTKILSPQPTRGPMSAPATPTVTVSSEQFPLPPVRAAPSTSAIPIDVGSPEDDLAATTPFHPGIPAAAGEYEVHRSSPIRYIHGAPLHNVIEEEDE